MAFRTLVICLLGVGVVALITILIWFARAPANYSIVGAIAGPYILYDSVHWRTEIINVDDERKKSAIVVVVQPPDDYDIRSVDKTADFFRELCSIVLSDFDRFNRYRISQDDLDHIQMNVRVGRQVAMQYNAAIVVRDKECIDGFLFFHPDFELNASSKHNRREHVIANFNSWGLVLDDLKFAGGTNGKIIKARYELIDKYGRNPATVDPNNLCILTLSSLKPKLDVFGIDFLVSDFDVMEITMSRGLNFGLFRFSRTWGPFPVSIEDGLCFFEETAQEQ